MSEAIGQLRWRALDSGVMNEPIDVDVNAAKTVAVVNIPTEGGGTDATSEQALATLRDEIIPPTRSARSPAPRSRLRATPRTARTSPSR